MGEDMRIHCLNSISKVGLNELPQDFTLTNSIEDADAILVRSAVMHELTVPQSLIAVARAGAGVNNIPLDVYAKQGIVCFNTPGANANAVKELILAGMLLASRDIIGGANWIVANQNDPEIAKTVEKAKNQFGGTEIKGKTIGIIGLGAIGMQLAKACSALGMKVIGYERFASRLDRLEMPESMVLASAVEELYPVSDFISLNVPLNNETKHMINSKALDLMKDGVVILNFARDLLVNDQDMSVALEGKKVRRYVTDFPNNETAKMKGVLAIPHLGASTEEAEDNCAYMAVHQLIDYIKQGNIKNSVNFPDASLGQKKHARITILGEVSLDPTKVIEMIGKQKVMQSVIQTNGKYTTMIYDLAKPTDEKLNQALKQLPGVLRIHLT